MGSEPTDKNTGNEGQSPVAERESDETSTALNHSIDGADQENSRPDTDASAKPVHEEAGSKKTASQAGPTWEADLDIYPLSEKSDDPKWAVRTVWIWVFIALVSLAFILTLLVLGMIYD